MDLQERSGVVVDNLLDRSDLFPVRKSLENSQLRLDQFNKLIGLGIFQLGEKLFYGELVPFRTSDKRHLRIT